MNQQGFYVNRCFIFYSDSKLHKIFNSNNIHRIQLIFTFCILLSMMNII